MNQQPESSSSKPFKAEQIQFLGCHWLVCAIRFPTQWDRGQDARSVDMKLKQHMFLHIGGMDDAPDDLHVHFGTVYQPVSEAQKKEVQLEFTIDFFFRVDELQAYVSASEDASNKTLDERIALSVASVAYSTARGMILERTLNLPIEPVKLAVLSPRRLLELPGTREEALKLH